MVLILLQTQIFILIFAAFQVVTLEGSMIDDDLIYTIELKYWFYIVYQRQYTNSLSSKCQTMKEDGIVDVAAHI